MMIAATLLPIDAGERRASDRIETHRRTTLRTAPTVPFDIMVRDLSSDGCFVETARTLRVGDCVTIGLAGGGRSEARVVRRDADGYGCMFLKPLSAESLSRAFSGVTIRDFPELANLPVVASDDFPPQIETWPRPVRLGILLGLAGLGWGAILHAVT